MTGRIYKVTCLENDKIYVGQTTKSLQKRWYVHLAHARNGRKCALHNAIRKYGVERFRIELIEDSP